MPRTPADRATLADRAALAEFLAEDLTPSGYVDRLQTRLQTFAALARAVGQGNAIWGHALAQKMRENARNAIIAERCAAVQLPPTGTASRMTRRQTDARMNDLYGREVR